VDVEEGAEVGPAKWGQGEADDGQYRKEEDWTGMANSKSHGGRDLG